MEAVSSLEGNFPCNGLASIHDDQYLECLTLDQ